MHIELRKVSKHFGAVAAVDEISFIIPDGSRVALLGPNGSGKSTLIRAILGLIECEGEVLLDGCSAFHHRSRLASRIAYIPQVAPQLNASVGELIRAIASLRNLSPDLIERESTALDFDLPATMGRPFRYLSGGMKQKLLAAIAFASRPDLLILDEPTASLDEQARQRFWRLLRERTPGATLLLCSHRLDEADGFVERVLLLQEGRLVQDKQDCGAVLRSFDPRASETIHGSISPALPAAVLERDHA